MYKDAGRVLMPCTRTKEPKHKGWQKTRVEQFDSASLGDYYGCVLTQEDFILDVDPRRFPDGQNSLTELFKELGLERQETFIVRTGSGGVHIYFKKPKGFRVRGRIPGYPAIDIKTGGGFVMAAGSKHGKDAWYTIERGNITTIIDAPQVLLDKCFKPDFDTSGTGWESDADATKNRYIQFLNSAPPAISGQGGNTQTYIVACEGKDYGLSEQSVFRLMYDYYNPRCKPDWEERELLQIVHNAYQHGQNKVGRYNPLNDFADEPGEPDTRIGSEVLQTSEMLSGSGADDADGNPYRDVDNIKGDSDVSVDKTDARFRVPEPGEINWDWFIDKGGTKKLYPVLTNILSFMRLPEDVNYKNPLFGLLKHNQFSDEIEFIKPAPWHIGYTQKTWSDADAIMLKAWLSDHKHFNAPINLFYEAAIVESRRYSYHPVRDYLNSLEWDGIPRIDMMLHDYCGAADNEYVRAVGRCTMLAAVARIFKPGCQHDSMLVLEGKQGIGKTSFVRILGGEWFADVQIDSHNKDTVHAMLGSWLLEASEMDFTRRQEVNAFKRFLTMTHDKVRLAYHRAVLDIPRQSIFIGTINPETGIGYLTDTTGNRRFLPVLCRHVKRPELKRDRDQLWAEAVHRFKKGEIWYIKEESVVALAVHEQRARQQMDSWHDTIADWIVDAEEITSVGIAWGALSIPENKVDRLVSNRISRVMKDLGYNHKSVYSKDKKRSCWIWVKEDEE